MQRHLLGVIAILFLLAAGGVHLLQLNVFFASSLFKLSLICGALWLSLPKLVEVSSRFSLTAVIFAIMCVVGIVFFPRLAIVLVPVLLVLGGIYLLGWLMRPERKKK
ncbi:MAG: hypothetical protein NXI22_21445 [bacterium]|nr:hypothetical protein [bacterium]